MRATFDLHIAGHQAEIEIAIEWMAELLNERGHFFDDDFEPLYGEGFAISGIRFYTVEALLAATELLPRVGISTISHSEPTHP